jgi:2-oxoglutarate ferredoxin oxidoreductase subunit alpha
MGNHNRKSAYFTRGTGHTENALYSEEPEIWEASMKRLNKKFKTALEYVPQSIICQVDHASVGLIAYGSTDPAVSEAQYILTERGFPVDYLRIRALPYQSEVHNFIDTHKVTYVVELNDQGQMKQILTLEQPDLATKIKSIAHIDGLPITAEWIVQMVIEMEGKNEI